MFRLIYKLFTVYICVILFVTMVAHLTISIRKGFSIIRQSKVFQTVICCALAALCAVYGRSPASVECEEAIPLYKKPLFLSCLYLFIIIHNMWLQSNYILLHLKMEMHTLEALKITASSVLLLFCLQVSV